MSGYVIGIDVGGTKVAYGLFAPDGALADRMEHTADVALDGPAFSDGLIDGIHSLMEKNGLGFEALDGVGVCMPSHILFDEGRIFLTSSLTRIKDFAMRDYLEARLPVKVVLDNDANGAALAEHRKGAGRGARHMVYVVVGTGLGSGIIIDGKLFRGSYGWAGECGHMLATPDAGVLCGCENRGCFMSHTSGRALPERIRLKLEAGAKSELTAECDGRQLLAAFNNGDALAAEVIEEMAKHIGVCVYNLYQMLNINTFVFGGGLINFGDVLLGRVRKVFDSYNHIPMPVYFKFAELEKDFGIIGAAEFIREA